MTQMDMKPQFDHGQRNMRHSHLIFLEKWLMVKLVNSNIYFEVAIQIKIQGGAKKRRLRIRKRICLFIGSLIKGFLVSEAKKELVPFESLTTSKK
mmetsp:Transcript_43940/g.61750  ORF Transcript_43940/g.61750 Transcript_43940/m.61750 type:complete len:95 (-) Transcript_43940:21-305(-)